MKWSGWEDALKAITRVPYSKSSIKEVYGILPNTPIYPLELCCERDRRVHLLEELIRDGIQPYKTWPVIEPHMSQKVVRTEIPWFAKAENVFVISHDLFRYVDNIFGFRLHGHDWVLVLLEEFDIQRTGVDIIVGFMVSEHELCFVTEYFTEDNGFSSEPEESVKMARVRRPDDRYMLKLNDWRRMTPIIPHLQHWFSAI